MPWDSTNGLLVAPGTRLTVDEAYTLWSETYDSVGNPLLALEERYLWPMLPSLAGKTVLDLGCGTGRLLNRLSASGVHRYFGVDKSAGMLARAAKKLQVPGQLLRADCLKLPLRSRTGDVVICSFLLGYVEIDELAEEIERVSNLGADLYLSEFHPDTRSLGWKREFRHGDQVIGLPTNDCSLDEVEHSFRIHGFDLVSSIEPAFGEAEREVFESNNKRYAFESSRGTRVLFIHHLRRSSRAV